MSRNGSALFVALIVVLLGAMVSVLATMIAMTEVRAGTAWRDQQVAAALTTSAVARSRDSAQVIFDSLSAGGSASIDSSVLLRRLGDSLALIIGTAHFRSGEEVAVALLHAGRDSLGGIRLWVPAARSRFHPIP